MPRSTGIIGLITAAPFESSLIIRKLTGKRRSGRFMLGSFAGKPVAHIAAGMGAANAAWGATLLLERNAPRLIILFGIGGAYPGAGLAIGDVAVASEEIYADLGVLMKYGLASLEETGIPLLRKGAKEYYNSFALDKKLLERAKEILPGLTSGVFLTVGQVTGTAKRARELRGRYHALCENMEGAAAAQVCTRHGTPLLEVRGISNLVEDRDTKRWDRGLAARNCQEAVLRLIKGF